MEVCILMVEKVPFRVVTIVRLGPYSVNETIKFKDALELQILSFSRV